MTRNAADAGIRAILLDVEGTTTPLAFVTQVLFPYARKHLRSHLDQHAGSAEYEALLDRLREEHEAAAPDSDPWTDEPPGARVASAATFVEWLMDRDRKSTALKELQGKIWEEGYQRGDLVGDVFPDVPRALRRWRERRQRVGIFSSGSVLAQQLLFRHSSQGDLTGFLTWYFDTRIGPKVAADSYRRIAKATGLPAAAILFVSDVTGELDAALEAGMQVRLSIRPGNPLDPGRHADAAIRSFDELPDLA